MRNLISLTLFAVLLAGSGCGTLFTQVGVVSRPEGLEMDLQGYRFLFRGVYSVRISATNVGDGMLYTVNDHEVFIQTGRDVLVDNQVVDAVLGEVTEVGRDGNRAVERTGTEIEKEEKENEIVKPINAGEPQRR